MVWPRAQYEESFVIYLYMYKNVDLYFWEYNPFGLTQNSRIVPWGKFKTASLKYCSKYLPTVTNKSRNNQCNQGVLTPTLAFELFCCPEANDIWIYFWYTQCSCTFALTTSLHRFFTDKSNQTITVNCLSRILISHLLCHDLDVLDDNILSTQWPTCILSASSKNTSNAYSLRAILILLLNRWDSRFEWEWTNCASLYFFNSFLS